MLKGLKGSSPPPPPYHPSRASSLALSLRRERTADHLPVLAGRDAHSFQSFLQFDDVHRSVPVAVQLLEELFKKAIGFVFLASHGGQQEAPYAAQHGHAVPRDPEKWESPSRRPQAEPLGSLRGSGCCQ